MKVWLLTEEYGYNRRLLKIFDSKQKAIKYTKKEFHLEDRQYETENLVTQITYSLPYEPSSPDYILEEWDIE